MAFKISSSAPHSREVTPLWDSEGAWDVQACCLIMHKPPDAAGMLVVPRPSAVAADNEVCWQAVEEGACDSGRLTPCEGGTAVTVTRHAS